MPWCFHDEKQTRPQPRMLQPKTRKWNKSEPETLYDVEIPLRPRGTEPNGVRHTITVAGTCWRRLDADASRMAVATRNSAALAGETYR